MWDAERMIFWRSPDKKIAKYNTRSGGNALLSTFFLTFGDEFKQI